MQAQVQTSQVVTTEQPILQSVARGASRGWSAFLQIWRVLAVLLLAVASYFIISHFFVQSVTVVGQSMNPTLANSQQYLLNRWVYYVRAPHARDVVVLRDPTDNGYSVKRIVAASGDTIYLKQGAIYVNGQRLVEPYLTAGTATYTSAQSNEQLFKCGPGQDFVLGDNRNNSVDSRVYGPVPRRNIIGLIIP